MTALLLSATPFWKRPFYSIKPQKVQDFLHRTVPVQKVLDFLRLSIQNCQKRRRIVESFKESNNIHKENINWSFSSKIFMNFKSVQVLRRKGLFMLLLLGKRRHHDKGKCCNFEIRGYFWAQTPVYVVLAMLFESPKD